MKNSLPDHLLSQLSEFVAARTALHFPRDRWGDLEHRTSSAAGEFGFTDKEAFIQWLVSSPLTREQIEILASHLTISETYFWREPQIFEALREHILPELIRSREKGEMRLRIWSAGCASGEEPYSIAIALRRLIPAAENWHLTILATDINPRILRRATSGVYGEWSFRNAPEWLKKEYFGPKQHGRFEIIPEIRKMVVFAYMNLAEDIYPTPFNNTNAMDLIFCRNVLMYFSPEHAGRIAQGFHRSLVDGGWLVVGASELSQQTFPQFTPAHFAGAIVYRKGRQEPRDREPGIGDQWPGIRGQGTGIWRDEERETKDEGQRTWGVLRTTDNGQLTMGPPQAGQPTTDHEPAGGGKDVQQAPTDSVRALANQGKLEDALASCERAIAAAKLDPELHYLRAIILQEQNKDAQAIASFKAALYLDPDFAPPHFALGNLMLRRGNRRAAKKCFDNVLALLSGCGQEEILPESEGLTAGRLREIIQATVRLSIDD